MSDYAQFGTFDGASLADETLAGLGAEALSGYDVDGILKRRAGRQLLGDGPSVVVPVRLTPAQDAALTVRTEQTGKTRSQVLRDAVDAYLVDA